MKAILQRVNNAKVEVDNKIVGKINQGLLVFIGISNDWNQEKFDWIIKKIINLRLWKSDKKGFDLSVKDINGEILVISQFTLHGEIKGNKPNFRNSLNYEEAKEIYSENKNIIRSWATPPAKAWWHLHPTKIINASLGVQYNS